MKRLAGDEGKRDDILRALDDLTLDYTVVKRTYLEKEAREILGDLLYPNEIFLGKRVSIWTIEWKNDESS